jgi:hypothetical protein
MVKRLEDEPSALLKKLRFSATGNPPRPPKMSGLAANPFAARTISSKLRMLFSSQCT